MLEIVDETGSTNADLSARLANGDDLPEGYWLVANRQTAGRGRQGRSWQGGEGNFIGSTIVHLREDDPPPATLSFVAALSVFATIAPLVTAQNRLHLKWPNDVFLNGGKVAGILLERVGNAVVVGIGVNLATAPELPDRPTATLHQAGAKIERDAFAAALSKNLRQRLDNWRWRERGMNMGLSATLSGFLWNSIHQVGARTSVNIGAGDVVTGAFAGLDETNGALCLHLDDGTERIIHAGDVILET